MANAMFCGIGCALATPFRDGRVDFEAFERLVQIQLDAGVDALIVCGTTGEPSALSDGETRELTERALSLAKGRIPVIAGAGANDTAEAVRRAKMQKDAGADALLSVTPYYNRANQDGLIRHFTEIADATDAPLILYNVPARTGVNLLPKTVETLLRHPNIQGVKEASSDMKQISELLRLCRDGCHVYCGSDELALPFFAMGASGAISVVSNVAPKLTRRIWAHVRQNDWIEARNAQDALLPLIQSLFSDVSPIPLKAALSMQGVCKDELRLPLTPLDAEKRRLLRAEMERLRLIS